ncbi:hypothetical protein VTN02DRAFT_3307 [Thermoascus thermophilus]
MVTSRCCSSRLHLDRDPPGRRQARGHPRLRRAEHLARPDEIDIQIDLSVQPAREIDLVRSTMSASADADPVRSHAADDDREDAPFLRSAGIPPVDSHDVDDDDDDGRRRLRLRLMLTLFAMILAVETGNAMVSGPTTRIYEAIACRRFYEIQDPSRIAPDGQVPEALCKRKEVQGEVATVTGYGEFFDGLFSVVLAIPYGLMADRRGRKPTVCLAIPGFVLNMVITLVVLWFSDVFPLRAVWLSSLAWLCGGGLVVAASIIWTMMADVTTESQRVAIFFQFGVAAMGSEFLSSAASSWLMGRDPWIPMLVGWGIMLAGVLAGLSLPETMPPSDASHALSDLRRSQEGEEQEETAAPTAKTGTGLTTLRRKVSSTVSPYGFVIANRQVLLLLSAFLVYRLSRGTAWFLVQYISARYGWTIARANLLVSLKSGFTVVLFTAILPALSWYLVRRRGTDTRRKDLILTRASIVFLLLGTLGIGLSPTVPALTVCLAVQTLGAGFVFAARALITALVPRHQTARLYTVVEILQAVGAIVASPTVTAFFRWGLDLGGGWVGLAWFVASGFFALVALVVWAVRLPPRAVRVEGDVAAES